MKLKSSITFISIIVLLSCFSCKSKEKELPIDESREILSVIAEQFNWIVGNWTISTDDYQMFESWELGNDNDITAFSYVLVEGDTVFSEYIRIHKIDDGYFMTVNVTNQNDGNAVDFKLIENKDSKFIFENTEHDFPQRIVYEMIAEDKLFAYIEGEQNGEYKREDFEFVRAE